MRGYLRLAIAGIVLWSLGAWTLSAFGFGSLKILRLYTLVLAVPAFAARQTPLSVFLGRRFATLGGSERAAVAALGAWFLCLAARTNLVSGFDAWWYGLRGEYALVATGSVFKSLDLVAPVNYYPKLYELLLIPVSGLHDTSVIEGISIGVLVLFALTCMELLKAIRARFPHAAAAHGALRDRAGDRERVALAEARSLRRLGAAARVPRRARVLARGPHQRGVLDHCRVRARVREQAERAAFHRRDPRRHARRLAVQRPAAARRARFGTPLRDRDRGRRDRRRRAA